MSLGRKKNTRFYLQESKILNSEFTKPIQAIISKFQLAAADESKFICVIAKRKFVKTQMLMKKQQALAHAGDCYTSLFV